MNKWTFLQATEMLITEIPFSCILKCRSKRVAKMDCKWTAYLLHEVNVKVRENAS